MAMQPMAPGTPEGQPVQGGMSEAQDQVSSLLGAVQLLGETIMKNENVPDPVKEKVGGATQGYLEAMTEFMSGVQGGAEPVEQMPGAQPVTPQGM